MLSTPYCLSNQGLVTTKSGLVAGSIAIEVLRFVIALIAIFSAVTVIAVVVLSARIGVERLVFGLVLSRLIDSVLISDSIAHVPPGSG